MRVDRRVIVVWSLGAALVALWPLLDLPSDDLSAATYRADLFSANGYLLWDNGWYAGHHVFAYSVLYPPLGALLGPRLLGALATVAAVVLFERLVARAYEGRAWPATGWFAVAAGANLFAGRVPFGLGLALGLATLLAARSAMLRRAARAAEGAREQHDPLDSIAGTVQPFTAAAELLETIAAQFTTLDEYSAGWAAADELCRPALTTLTQALTMARGALLAGQLDPTAHESIERRIAQIREIAGRLGGT